MNFFKLEILFSLHFGSLFLLLNLSLLTHWILSVHPHSSVLVICVTNSSLPARGQFSHSGSFLLQ